MNTKLWSFFLITILNCLIQGLHAQISYQPERNDFVFSAIRATVSKPDSVIINSTAESIRLKWLDGDSVYFKIRISKILGIKQTKIILCFKPPADFVGIARATFQIAKSAEKARQFKVTGLSSMGIEGSHEPPLSTIINALGYSTDIGWKELSNHSDAQLMGEELAVAVFQKAGIGKVEMIPVARYSPDFVLPFGYYTNEINGPSRHQLGVLPKAAKYPEHQTLFPSVTSEADSFDPGKKIFGFYASGSGHTAYSEDCWNLLLHPAYPVHATRIFPVRDANGAPVKNTYLLCFEEAKNGDYNDYVFLVKNITPVTGQCFVDLFNGINLNGWNTFLRDIGKNKDPNDNFRIKDGSIHVIGKDLGYMITEKGYRNFHFKVDFKWGVAKWPTRENEKRDAGICYNIPLNEPDSIWPQSIECQIQEGDVGDFWLLGFSSITVKGLTNKPMNHARVIKSKDAEKPYGGWNTVEVISYNGKCIHIVNGVEVNRGEEASIRQGRILLQSEFAEIYYRDPKIKQL